jgi:hypothetical protein
MSATNGYGANGRFPEPGEDQESRIIAAIEAAYEFPGYYPVVVFARSGLDFAATLFAAVAAEQGEEPFRITERASRQGTYRAYRVELFVSDARGAVARKAVLAALEGVLFVM